MHGVEKYFFLSQKVFFSHSTSSPLYQPSQSHFFNRGCRISICIHRGIYLCCFTHFIKFEIVHTSSWSSTIFIFFITFGLGFTAGLTFRGLWTGKIQLVSRKWSILKIFQSLRPEGYFQWVTEGNILEQSYFLQSISVWNHWLSRDLWEAYW